MAADERHEEERRGEVRRRVRRAVGFKALRDLGRWADDVEREQRERPRLVLRLMIVVALIGVAAAAAVYLRYRGG